MKNEIATVQQADLTPAERMFSQLMEAANNPDIDAGKIQALADVQTQVLRTAADEKARLARDAFNRAMFQARRGMPRITRDGAITNKAGNVQSRYATYEAIDRVARPIWEAEGLDVGFELSGDETGKVLVTCIVTSMDAEHGSHVERFGPMPLAIDTTGSKNATQGAGSAGSYGKRHTLCAAFNIITENEDKDGAAARQIAKPTEAWQAEVSAKAQAAAQNEAAGSAGAYKRYLDTLPQMHRGWLFDSGEHDANKRTAGI